jgi:hypothetical protein
MPPAASNVDLKFLNCSNSWISPMDATFNFNKEISVSKLYFSKILAAISIQSTLVE